MTAEPTTDILIQRLAGEIKFNHAALCHSAAVVESHALRRNAMLVELHDDYGQTLERIAELVDMRPMQVRNIIWRTKGKAQ